MTGLVVAGVIGNDRGMLTWHPTTTAGGGGWRSELAAAAVYLGLRATQPGRYERLPAAVAIAFLPSRRWERADRLDRLVAGQFWQSASSGDALRMVERARRSGGG